MVKKKYLLCNQKIEDMTFLELFELHTKIISELKNRKILRTNNNPVGDYSEWIVSKVLKMKLEENPSKAGFDAKKMGTKYQIKGRRLTHENKSKKLGVIRNYESKPFDYLIALLLDEKYLVTEAYKIPYKLVKTYAANNDYQGGLILELKGDLLKDPQVKDITKKFNKWFKKVRGKK